VKETYYVLDREDRLRMVVGSLKETLAPFLGHTIWEAAPQAEPLFSPHLQEARSTGREVEFTVFYGGRLTSRRVVPAGDMLTVHVTVLRELDVRTLATLDESLRAIEAELADRASAQPDPRAPGSLRALP
jgi:hypothetical protein